MNASQVQAALGLLKKVVPDQQHTVLSAPDGGPLQFEKIVREVVKA